MVLRFWKCSVTWDSNVVEKNQGLKWTLLKSLKTGSIHSFYVLERDDQRRHLQLCNLHIKSIRSTLRRESKLTNGSASKANFQIFFTVDVLVSSLFVVKVCACSEAKITSFC